LSDKNLHQPELASEHFKSLQNAYTVLKDPQERAWLIFDFIFSFYFICSWYFFFSLIRYDSHKEQILRGGASGSQATDDDPESSGKDDAMNLWPFFSSSCYNGYTDPKEVRKEKLFFLFIVLFILTYKCNYLFVFM
jgi:DnaJ-class molecular chaperone